jgi:quercetin dioxygenase-like cupin family protein
MSFEVYDYRTTNRNVLITPEIRARLYHMKPGQVDSRHSHDLGHEIFLILEGQAEFNINGDKKVLGPGEMCIALADEIHQVRNMLPDKETIMYLSVTPHVQPTHTRRNDDDSAAPPRFNPNTNYHVETDPNVSLDDLLDAHIAHARAVLEAAQANLSRAEATASKLRDAWQKGDNRAAVEARNALWETVYTLHKKLYAMDEVWNEFSPRAATNED